MLRICYDKSESCYVSGKCSQISIKFISPILPPFLALSSTLSIIHLDLLYPTISNFYNNFSFPALLFVLSFSLFPFISYFSFSLSLSLSLSISLSFSFSLFLSLSPLLPLSPYSSFSLLRHKAPASMRNGFLSLCLGIGWNVRFGVEGKTPLSLARTHFLNLSIYICLIIFLCFLCSEY